jgi:hypothetical protein
MRKRANENELRIDAAKNAKVKRRFPGAAASIRVERSRAPEETNQLEIKAQVSAGIAQPKPKSTKE